MSEVSTPIETNLLPAAASSLSAQFREAYNSVAAELTAIPTHELIAVNIDVPKAVTTVLGALPEIRAQRAAALGLPGFDVGRIDILERAARAAAFALLATRRQRRPSSHCRSWARSARVSALCCFQTPRRW